MTTSHPKIGIRPIIDGRRGGIRESLEAMTMGMAQRVARLYSEELRYSDGSPVECVIADTTIGGVAEAAACTDKFRDSNVGAVLSVTPCWCYGAETIDMDPLIPKAIWGFNGTERPGAVYLASALAGHNQKGLPAFGIYGRDVQDMDDDTFPPTYAKNSCVSAAPPSRSCRCGANPISRSARCRWVSQVLCPTPISFRSTSACAMKR